MNVQWDMTLEEKLAILADGAKYDVSCVSSGVDRKNDGTGMGNSIAAGICHSFGSDGRCISLLKILMSNDCCYDCKYCVNRATNNVPRATFTPEEICQLTMGFYRRNYIEGLFLSSGVIHTPDYTMEQMYIALWQLRYTYNFQGYIHVKIIPGADSELVSRIGFLADRVSCNLELPTAKGLSYLAPAKTREKILTPMRYISHNIRKHTNADSLPIPVGVKTIDDKGFLSMKPLDGGMIPSQRIFSPAKRSTALFAPAGQSTQMIVGATKESDYEILAVTESLYNKFQMKRVFYSAYVPVNDDSSLPAIGTKPPLLREHRLYQADWLLRFYGFKAGELLNEQKKNFNTLFDPKCDWAISHLEHFPVEVNKADYYTLLRVPGIGVYSARRICQARKTAVLGFDDLKRMGIVLKRALYFITCQGKMMYPTKIDQDYIMRNLLSVGEKLPDYVRDPGITYRQLSLFTDMGLEVSG